MKHHERRFDWDEARRRFAAGESACAIARSFGVSRTAITRVVDDGTYERMRQTCLRLAEKGATCPGCGGRMALTTRYGGGLCRACVAAERMLLPDECGRIRCSTCKQWLAPGAFSHDPRKPHRYHRGMECRACCAGRKRKRRARMSPEERERERARNRERLAASRAARSSRTAAIVDGSYDVLPYIAGAAAEEGEA